MRGDSCIVLDSRGRQFAGPFQNEGAARMWVAFNFYRYRIPFTITCASAEWEPVAVYDAVANLPRDIWERQARGELIVVRTARGTLAVLV